MGSYAIQKKQTVNNWEKGRNEPSLERLKLIAEMAGKSVSEFVYGVPSAKTIQRLIEYLEKREKEFYAHKNSADSFYTEWLDGQVHVLEKNKEVGE